MLLPKPNKRDKKADKEFQKKVTALDATCMDLTCPCHRTLFINITAHRIIPKSQGGRNDISNEISLCVLAREKVHEGGYMINNENGYLKRYSGNEVMLKILEDHRDTYYDRWRKTRKRLRNITNRKKKAG